MRTEDVNAMSEIFQEHGISATIEIIEKVTNDFIDHLDANLLMFGLKITL